MADEAGPMAPQWRRVLQATSPGRPASARPTANGLSPSSVTRWMLHSVTLSPGGTNRATQSDGQPGISVPRMKGSFPVSADRLR